LAEAYTQPVDHNRVELMALFQRRDEKSQSSV
jgi:hypothetical protein